jgi:hypothetical protein
MAARMSVINRVAPKKATTHATEKEKMSQSTNKWRKPKRSEQIAYDKSMLLSKLNIFLAGGKNGNL